MKFKVTFYLASGGTGSDLVESDDLLVVGDCIIRIAECLSRNKWVPFQNSVVNGDEVSCFCVEKIEEAA